ncbi:polysaccharide biosynthesis tyrosine autokinase [Fangia hongkongensis]|uniref:polysaccharide biosynthesis tyrosine autokinase n=1 Tax=Fangia hongkongensis TaxID=270495 RepID=UPI00037570F9|nr:polysaccharide biosynthesis tyrosine autokinase [Fangia hongkongensis]MBK2125477.1 polysaccharide biosynthesis tyrosine autokinase [Fangia hongkongensis]
MSFKSKKKDTMMQEDVIDIRDILGIVLNRKWLVLSFTCLFAIIMLIYGLQRAPMYKSDLLMNISTDSANQSIGNLLSDNIPFMQSKDGMSSKMQEIMRSRSVLTPVIEKLRLDVEIKPYYFPVIGKIVANYASQSLPEGVPAKPFLGLSGYNWGGAIAAVSTFQPPKGLYGETFTIVALSKDKYKLISPEGEVLLADGKVGKDYSIAMGQGESLDINLKELVANVGEEFAISKLRDTVALNALTQDLSIQSEEKGSNILRLSYQGANPYIVAEVLNDLGQSAIENDVERKSKNAKQVLSFLKTQLPMVQAKLDDAQHKLNAYRSKTGNLSIADETKIILQKFSGYDTQLSELELQLSQSAQVLTEKNPEILQLKSAISKVKSQRDTLQQKIKALPKSDQVYVNLMRDVEVQEKVYQTIIGKIQKYEIMQAATVSSLEVIDSAHIPYKNINKPTLLLVLLGAIVGLILSVGWIFLQAYLIKGLQDPEIIEEILGFGSVGAVYFSKLQQAQSKKFRKKLTSKLKLIHEIDPHDVILESFRSIRTSIELKKLTAKNKLIAISGPTENIGKSFVSVNLAYSLAAAGRKVLIIDADLRKGHLKSYFNKKDGLGLSQYLSQESISEEEIIQKTRFDQIDFISYGEHTTNSTEFLVSPKFAALLDFANEHYDYVIVDTPPVLPVADSTIILQKTAINLFVLKCSGHDKKALKLMMNKLDNAGVSKEGFILNGITGTSTYYHKKYQYKSYS